MAVNGSIVAAQATIVAIVSCLLAGTATAQQPAQPRLFQPPRDVVAPATGTAAIKGRVVETGSNQPIRKARIHAASPALRDGRTTYSDANGAFELSALPAGHYTVTTAKLGYVPAAYGQPRVMELGTAIDVSDGKIVAPIDVAMSRAGVIAGRITDEFGEPLPNTRVAAMRYQGANGNRRLMPAAARVTNDIGEFRIFGLVPGEYYLEATLPGNDVQLYDPDTGNRPAVYAPTYYPGTANAGSAQPLTITTGQTLSGTNLMLLPVRPVRVTGTVSDSTGALLVNASVMAALRESGPGSVVASSVGRDGSFTLAGLTAGEYVLRVRTGMPQSGAESAAVPFTVGTSDVTNVHIVTSPPTSVTGRVHVDPSELGSLRPTIFRLNAPAGTPGDIGVSGGANTMVKDDFTFELKIPPGRVFIRSNTAGWFLRSVRIQGVDVLDSGVTVQPNQPITDVEIQITNKQPEVTGTVRTAAGDPTRTAYIVVFPQNSALWGFGSRYVRMVRPNPDNKYRALVPPGDYYEVALDHVEGAEWSEPDFLERVREKAVTISLQDGDHKTQDLSLVPSSPQ
jgi:hypothetical protein